MRISILFFLSACTHSTLSVYGSTNGALLWKNETLSDIFAATGDTLFGYQDEKTLVAMAASDGHVLWKKNAPPVLLAATDGVVVAESDKQTLAGFAVANGATLWTTPLDTAFVEVTIPADGQAQLGSEVLDAHTGQKATAAFLVRDQCVNQYCGDTNVVWVASSAAANFVLFEDGTLTALDTSGAVLWSEASPWMQIRFAQNALIASDDSEITLLDVQSGKPLWTAPQTDTDWQAAVGADAIYVSYPSAEQVAAIELTTGNVRWTIAGKFGEQVAVYDGAEIHALSAVLDLTHFCAATRPPAQR